ncbi:hypothetical protein T08_13087 [Trichinella sp. T8]|nr:hypothetical protein T08_13087 [Trichinella sp. T8]
MDSDAQKQFLSATRGAATPVVFQCSPNTSLDGWSMKSHPTTELIYAVCSLNSVCVVTCFIDHLP